MIICRLAVLSVLLAMLGCQAANAQISNQPPMAVEQTETRGSIALDGLWRFMPARGYSARTPRGEWGQIKVPGNWNRNSARDLAQRGAGDAWVDFAGEHLAQTWYERTVLIPAHWTERTVRLELDLLSTDAMVFINGNETGKINWPGGSLDITRFVQPGMDTKVRLKVIAADDHKDVEIRMGYGENEKVSAKLEFRGLIGSVSLLSLPSGGHLEDVFVRPSTPSQKLQLDLELAGLNEPNMFKLLAEALDESGKVEITFSALAKASSNGVTAGTNVLTLVVWDRGIHGGWDGAPKQISLRAAGEPAPFYHPDYRDDDLDLDATSESAWQARQDQWGIADSPYRYYRW